MDLTPTALQRNVCEEVGEELAPPVCLQLAPPSALLHIEGVPHVHLAVFVKDAGAGVDAKVVLEINKSDKT